MQTAEPQTQLSLSFKQGPDGRTYLDRQLARYPLHICRAQYLDPESPELAALYTQSCSGGLFAGERLTQEVQFAEGAQAHLTTQASTIVHRTDDEHASQKITIDVGAGAFFEYLPDPLIE